MFNVGELKEVLEVCREVKKSNRLGIPSRDLKTLFKLRCKRTVQSSKEYLSANRETESQIVRFLVYCRRGIYLDNIVLYKHEKYNIVHINPYSDTGFIELICEVKR